MWWNRKQSQSSPSQKSLVLDRDEAPASGSTIKPMKNPARAVCHPAETGFPIGTRDKKAAGSELSLIPLPVDPESSSGSIESLHPDVHDLHVVLEHLGV